jgi:hypothetical protein
VQDEQGRYRTAIPTCSGPPFQHETNLQRSRRYVYSRLIRSKDEDAQRGKRDFPFLVSEGEGGKERGSSAKLHREAGAHWARDGWALRESSRGMSAHHNQTSKYGQGVGFVPIVFRIYEDRTIQGLNYE